MLDSWLFALLFVGGVTVGVWVIARWIVDNDARRDARRRNRR